MEDPELEAIRARRLKQLMSASASQTSMVSGGRPFAVTDCTFDAEIRRPGLILVDFWAEWCGPCHRIAPVLEQLANDRAASLRICKLNVDENPQTAMRFQVMSIPTMLLFKEGKLVDGIVGAVPRAEIEAMLARWS